MGFEKLCSTLRENKPRASEKIMLSVLLNKGEAVKVALLVDKSLGKTFDGAPHTWAEKYIFLGTKY